MIVNEVKKKEFVDKLLSWSYFSTSEFPWRKSNDPFRIMVVEFFLQRTKAEQVRKIYEKFFHKFPDLYSLYTADLSEVKEMIKPLGLAYRATRLKNIVSDIYLRYDGIIPKEHNSLISLNGIGLYISSALRCFAFDENISVVDTNVLRIIQRVFSFSNLQNLHRNLKIWQFMQSLIPYKKAKYFNWALIDLGRTICTPKNPKCDLCPIASICNFANKVDF